MRQKAIPCIDPYKRDLYVRFQKSVLDGVEIKRSKGSGYDYKPHVHKELSLGYILTGSTELTVSDRVIRYQAGDGVIIPPLASHRCAPDDKDKWEYVMLFIRPEYYADALHFHRPQRLTGAAVTALKAFIAQLLLEPDPDDAEAVLLDLLLTFGDAAEPELPDADKAVRRVHDYIVAHPGERITLDRMQEISKLNKFTLIRSFKKAYVATPSAFHLQCRVAEAKRRLHRGCDVLTVCDELHFFDQAHLIREFRRMYGITPAAYIAQLTP